MKKKPISIEMRGAEQNNLKKINLDIPLHSFCVICGPSGSGKSSLAYETLFAEGQRRYTETLSNYARQYIPSAPKPLVESMKNIPPPVLLGQRNTVRSSRSTAGTHSEVMDHLRVIFSKEAQAFCPEHQTPLEDHSIEKGVHLLKKWEKGFLLFPIEASSFKNKKQMIKQLMKDGFLRIGFFKNKKFKTDLISEMKTLPSSFYVVFDRLLFKDKDRVSDSLGGCYEASMKYNPSFSGGQALALNLKNESLFLSQHPLCPLCRKPFSLQVTPALFSFNSPVGACKTCSGFGNILSIDENKIVPNPYLTLAQGALHIFSTPATAFERRQMKAFCKLKKIDMHTPWIELNKISRQSLWKGGRNFCGVLGFFKMLEEQRYKMHVRILLARYKSPKVCSGCKGGRLREETKWLRLQDKSRQGKSIDKWAELTFKKLEEELSSLSQHRSCESAVKALKRKIELINKMGLSYLTLNRPTRTLSGGELQRLNLAVRLGMGLSQILYILDEPTIGLHPCDTQKLISILKGLKEHGNTLVVIEHDLDVIREAEYIVEMGPGSGFQGGKVVFQGLKKDFLKKKNSLFEEIKTPRKKRTMDQHHFKNFLKLKKCSMYNLKNINVKIPLNRLSVCTGVSGSGKSAFTVSTLYPVLKKIIGLSVHQKKIPDSIFKKFSFSSIEGFEKIRRVILVDQNPAEKTLRSIVATYCGIFTPIRNLMAEAARSNKGVSPGSFSLNVDGGRCPECRGLGYQEVEMVFMDPIRMTCSLCRGLKYQKNILDIRFRNKNIQNILEMTVSEAMLFFTIYPPIFGPLALLQKVGLSYLKLGQSLSTLSGGESQRLKLTRELSDSKIKGTFYIFDEPSTGLHTSEIKWLLEVLDQLVERGGSVFLIEHHLQMIAHADYIIDLGPDGGDKGGQVTAQGPPGLILKSKGATAKCLRTFLDKDSKTSTVNGSG